VSGLCRLNKGLVPAVVLMSTLLMVSTASVATQTPALATVLSRASGYAADFKQQFARVVMEEIYIQDVDSYTRLRPEVTHRELKSDLLLVRPEEGGRHIEFRDVAEVDGRAVRDRAERLTRLFIDPSRLDEQVQQIIEESARYNIGKVLRNVNTPTLALMFFDPLYQPRFTFSIAADRTPSLAMRSGHASDATSPRFVVSADVWVIEYRESSTPTIIRSPEGRNMPARGRFWLDGDSGRVLMTELVAGDSTLKATIDVSYQSEPVLGFSVPVEMRERYDAPNIVITGTARYSNFRRFEVQVDDKPGRP